MPKKPKGLGKFSGLLRKLVKPADEPKRFCPKCSHDRWQHGDNGCRKPGCGCRLRFEET